MAFTHTEVTNRRYFASPSNPFELLEDVNEVGQGIYREYDITYEDLGRPQYSEELFLAVTLAYWLSAFVFLSSEGNEIREETFPMASQMARRRRTVVASAVYPQFIPTWTLSPIGGNCLKTRKENSKSIICMGGWQPIVRRLITSNFQFPMTYH